MGQAHLTLHELLPAHELADALDAGHVTRKAHPELPLSIYTYTRTCQYERRWNRVTVRCRGLVADDATGRIVALPLPKFFNAGEHASGQPYAPALPDEPFEVYDKVDGSLAVVFHYADRWHAASKGSFTSTQARWAQRRLDAGDTSALEPGVTYLAEILYPENRIVVDNTHLTPHIPKRLKAAVAGRAVFVVHDLTDVDVEECVRRDAVRERPVGEEIIRLLADKHLKSRKGGWRLTDAWFNDRQPVLPYVADPALPSAVMCDIDGTLALRGDRGPFDFSRCDEDTLNISVRQALSSFRRADGDAVVLLSGRSEDHREMTEAWLRRHEVPYDELWMRAADDGRRDDVVKAELFDRHVRHRFAVRVSLDDRDRVVAVWRRMGLPTWQVNYGAF
ncbi:RNA ligase [Streptomyces zhihengii]|uniref:phosphatase domain-containing protein n=1 Tax=Streptomyces zhihengii TaxID=1818004 RepID=UPI001FD4E611|nr:RNA ligase [Streptomyces zhihengii]